MIRTQVYLHDQQYHLAKLFASASGSAFSDFIRHGVDLAIKEKQKRAVSKNKKKKIGALDAVFGKYACESSRNIATTHDDIYDL